MLRRVARVTRIVLFVLGSLILVLFPVSWFVAGTLRNGWVGDRLVAGVYRGSVQVQFWKALFPGDGLRNWTEWDLTSDVSELDVSRHQALIPGTSHYNVGGFGAWEVRTISLPLWLLAFLCLAWPVTSFLLARRRRGRGFPVETEIRPDLDTGVNSHGN